MAEHFPSRLGPPTHSERTASRLDQPPLSKSLPDGGADNDRPLVLNGGECAQFSTSFEGRWPTIPLIVQVQFIGGKCKRAEGGHPAGSSFLEKWCAEGEARGAVLGYAHERSRVSFEIFFSHALLMPGGLVDAAPHVVSSLLVVLHVVHVDVSKENCFYTHAFPLQFLWAAAITGGPLVPPPSRE